jgi:4-hydroxy-3-methylbut-2-enyl diphosphate reductase
MKGLKVRLAKTAGFCMGVRRAMEMVLSEANRGRGRILTYGPLIHNKQVMDLLASKGVNVVEDIPDQGKETVVIRAHGIEPRQRETLKASGLRLVDATCPRVARVQSIIRYHTKKGYTAVIVGDSDHPEVIGLVGYGNGHAYVINSVNEVIGLPESQKVFVVAQTTQEIESYREIVRAIRGRFPDALIFDTICEATHSRQEEVKSFSGQVGGVVVVGGYHSGNTQRLVQVSQAAAGASTPNWMIKNVVKEIEGIESRRETLPGRWIRKVLKFLLLSNLLVAFGAFALSYAVTILSGRRPDLIHPAIAFLYIYAMHVLNRFLDKGASTYNDPERANFHMKYRGFLMLTAIAALIGALGLSYHLGARIFLAVAGLSALGTIYSIPLVPARLRHIWRYSKIKDIPGSKTFSEALAWAALIALIPLLDTTEIDWPAASVSFVLVFSMVYVRSALFDVFQVQGDMIVGIETLANTLGEKRTLLLLKGISAAAALVLLIAPIFGSVSPFSYLLVLCLVALFLSLLVYEKKWLYADSRLELLIEGNLFLAGVLGVVWQGLA